MQLPYSVRARLLVMMILAAQSTLWMAPAAFAQDKYPCEGASVSDMVIGVRAAPQPGSEIVVALRPGRPATALALDESGSWVQLELSDGRSGWTEVENFECAPSAQSNSEEGGPPASAHNVPGENGQLCVLTFDDINGNRMQDVGDGVSQPAAFQLAGNAAPIQQDENGCAELPPGTYRVQVALPVGREAAISDEWHVNVVAEYSTQLQIALVVETEEPAAEITAAGEATPDSGPGSFLDRATVFAQKQYQDARELFSNNPLAIILVSCSCVVLLLAFNLLLFSVVMRRRRARAAAAQAY